MKTALAKCCSAPCSNSLPLSDCFLHFPLPDAAGRAGGCAAYHADHARGNQEGRGVRSVMRRQHAPSSNGCMMQAYGLRRPTLANPGVSCSANVGQKETSFPSIRTLTPSGIGRSQRTCLSEHSAPHCLQTRLCLSGLLYCTKVMSKEDTVRRWYRRCGGQISTHGWLLSRRHHAHVPHALARMAGNLNLNSAAVWLSQLAGCR